jgi:hypothetical protein
MSYHKLLQTLSNRQNQLNTVLTHNTTDNKLEFKNNINIQNLNENNFKIDNNSSIEINKINSENIINSSLKSDQNINITGSINIDNKIQISKSSTSLNLSSTNNQILNIKNQNIKTFFNPTDMTINYGKMYGNLQYVDNDKLISWISQKYLDEDEIEIKKGVTGFELTKKNSNNNITYITCDPDSIYSTYSKDDIINNSLVANSYNFRNDNNSLTNTLYLRPGMTNQTKEKYLKGLEHTFIIDTQRDLLPGWGFENSHPLIQNSSYIDIKNEIFNNVNLRKRSQTIALDLSELINSNSIYPGYKINLIIKDPIVEIPDMIPALIQNEYSNISPVSNWQNFTFDTRYTQFSKSDLDSDSTLKQNFFNLSPYNIYELPYYNSLTNFPNSLPSGNVKQNSGCGANTYTNSYYRNSGTYTTNNISVYYFKPYFMINLGLNNIIVNNTNIFLKRVESKTNIIPYYINDNILSIINNLFGTNSKINYFITSGQQSDSDFSLTHLNEIDQNFIQNQNLNANYLKISSYNDSNIKNNLTLKLNKNFYANKLSLFELLTIYQNKLITSTTHVISYSFCGTNSPGGFVKNVYNVYAVKTKKIINIPFTNIINSINLNDSNYNDWYYLDLWKTDSHNISNANNQSLLNDFVLNDMTFESQYSSATSNVLTYDNVYSIAPSNTSTKSVYNNLNGLKQRVISLMYIGKNSITNKNEWIYV